MKCVLAALAAVAVLLCGSAEAADRPNIVVVMVDDMGYADLGCYGGEIRTPNIDALARGGTHWRSFYNCAQCCPTRASLMTGLYPHQAGVGDMIDPHSKATRDAAKSPAYSDRLDPKAITLPQALRSAGYQTYMVGKWHLGSSDGQRPLQRGFDQYFGITAGADSYFKPATLRSGDEPVKDVPADFYATDDFTSRAIQFIENGDPARPFFLYAAYNAPHSPFHALPADIEAYRGVYDAGWDVIRRRRFEQQKALGFWPRTADLPPRVQADAQWTPTEAQTKSAERMTRYAAIMQRVDHNVGRLVDVLKRKGMLENTLILFLSDNGAWASSATYGREWAETGNTPLRLFKVQVHEGGICTPLIAHWPKGIRGDGALNTRAYGHVKDIFATCMEAAGVESPVKESRSLLGQLLDGTVVDESPLFWERRGHEAVRIGRWKLVRSYSAPAGMNPDGDTAGPRTGQWELYDLQEDPLESRDLAATQPERVAQLAKQHAEWSARVGVVDRAKIVEQMR
jgi:arylsulfatase